MEREQPYPDEITEHDLEEAIASERVRTARKALWTFVLRNGVEAPVRPAVLEAMGELPDAPVGTHAAVAKLREMGVQLRYKGQPA